MLASRKLEDLHPIVADKAQRFLDACESAGIHVIITSTLRDFESQNELYAQGRTKPGKIVTKAKGGESFHNFGVAFDFCPIVNGKPAWTDIALFNKCGEIGEGVGLEWAGRWKSFKELAHFQFTGGLTLKDFQEGKRL